MFYVLLCVTYVHSSFEIILMGKRAYSFALFVFLDSRLYNLSTVKTCVRKQPIIALYFESENELKFHNLQAWCLVIVVCLFLTIPWVCLQFVIVVFPDHAHYFWNFCWLFGV